MRKTYWLIGNISYYHLLQMQLKPNRAIQYLTKDFRMLYRLGISNRTWKILFTLFRHLTLFWIPYIQYIMVPYLIDKHFTIQCRWVEIHFRGACTWVAHILQYSIIWVAILYLIVYWNDKSNHVKFGFQIFFFHNLYHTFRHGTFITLRLS